MSWGLEVRSIFLYVPATTGEVLFSKGPHGILEDIESVDDDIEKGKYYLIVYSLIFRIG